MVSILGSKVGNLAGFDIDSLLGSSTKMSSFGTDFLHNSDSAFTNVKSTSKDFIRLEPLVSDRDCFPVPSMTHSVTVPQAGHQHGHKDNQFCVQCFDSNVSSLQDNLLDSVRSYDMPTQNLANINNINARNIFRSSAFSSHTWPLLDPSSTTTAFQGHEYRHSNLGNFSLKLHNNLVQLDNISTMSNISGIGNSYSHFPSIYPGMSQSQFGNQVGTGRLDNGVSGPTFTWGSSRGASFLTSRCPGKW